MSQEQQPKKGKAPSKFIRFTGVAFQMGGTIFLGNYFGKWLDGKYNTDHWETIITMLAVFTSMYLVISQVIKLSKEDD